MARNRGLQYINIAEIGNLFGWDFRDKAFSPHPMIIYANERENDGGDLSFLASKKRIPEDDNYK